MKTTMDARIQDQPISRLWTANYTRAWVANFLLLFYRPAGFPFPCADASLRANW